VPANQRFSHKKENIMDVAINTVAAHPEDAIWTASVIRCAAGIAEAKASGDGALADELNWDLAIVAEKISDAQVASWAAAMVDPVAYDRYCEDMRVEHTAFGRRELAKLIKKLRAAEGKLNLEAIKAATHAIEKFAAEDPIHENACRFVREEAANFLRLRTIVVN